MAGTPAAEAGGKGAGRAKNTLRKGCSEHQRTPGPYNAASTRRPTQHHTRQPPPAAPSPAEGPRSGSPVGRGGVGRTGAQQGVRRVRHGGGRGRSTGERRSTAVQRLTTGPDGPSWPRCRPGGGARPGRRGGGGPLRSPPPRVSGPLRYPGRPLRRSHADAGSAPLPFRIPACPLRSHAGAARPGGAVRFAPGPERFALPDGPSIRCADRGQAAPRPHPAPGRAPVLTCINTRFPLDR